MGPGSRVEAAPMSKRKIDETVTQARVARARKARDAQKKPPAKAARAGEPKPRVAKGSKEKPEIQKNRENLVVFAFRLTEAERDLIHKAAGPSKASRYVRTLAVAAARGDEMAVKEILRGTAGTTL